MKLLLGGGVWDFVEGGGSIPGSYWNSLLPTLIGVRRFSVDHRQAYQESARAFETGFEERLVCSGLAFGTKYE